MRETQQRRCTVRGMAAAVWLVGHAAMAMAQPAGLHSALSFDGNNDRVEVAHSATLDLTGEFTLEAWVRLPAAQDTASFVGPLISKMVDHTDTSANYVLGIRNADNRAVLTIGDGVGGSQSVVGTSNLGTSTWVHVAGVRTGSSLLIYVNGVLESSSSLTLSQVVNAAPLRIGGVPSILNEQLFLQAVVDEVRVWQVARTALQIQENVFRSLTGLETGLVGYWRLNEAAGQVVFDAAPAGNAGVRGGSTAVEVSDPVWVTSEVALNPPASTGAATPPVLTGSVAGGVATLLWTTTPPAPSSYIVQVASDPSFATIVFSLNVGLATTASGPIPPGFTGWARVLALGASGQGISNTFLISATACAVPAPPGGLTVTVTGSSAVVSWLGTAGATSYRVEADVNNVRNVVAGEVGNVTAVSGQGLTSGTYVVRVYALSPCGSSPATIATFSVP